MALDLSALADEIRNDPEGFGYAEMGGNGEIRDALNATDPSRPQNREDVGRKELSEAIVFSEFNTLSLAPRQYLTDVLLASAPIDANASEIVSAVQTIFAAAPLSLANFVALRTRDGSRAEELFGRGVKITVSNIGDALNLP